MEVGSVVSLCDRTGAHRCRCEVVSRGAPGTGLVNLRLLEPLNIGGFVYDVGHLIESPERYVAQAADSVHRIP